MQIYKEFLTCVKKHDPSFKKTFEIFLYPGFKILFYYKISRYFYLRNFFFLSRYFMEK